MGFLHRVDRDDMRVAERGRRPRFALEALDHAGAHLKQGRREHLDRHLAIQREVMGEVDGGHAAAPQHTEDFVFAERGAAERNLDGFWRPIATHRRRRHRLGR